MNQEMCGCLDPPGVDRLCRLVDRYVHVAAKVMASLGTARLTVTPRGDGVLRSMPWPFRVTRTSRYLARGYFVEQLRVMGEVLSRWAVLCPEHGQQWQKRADQVQQAMATYAPAQRRVFSKILFGVMVFSLWVTLVMAGEIGRAHV